MDFQMSNKTAFIQIRISQENKKKLKDKAKEFNLNLSELIEKVAENEVLFISKGIKVMLEGK